MEFVLALVMLRAYLKSKIYDVKFYMNTAKMETCIEILLEENTHK